MAYGKQIGNVSKACRHFGIPGEIVYRWKRAYEREGEKALINSKPCPQNPNVRVPQHVEELTSIFAQPITWDHIASLGT